MSDTLMTQGIGSVAALTDLRQTVIFVRQYIGCVYYDICDYIFDGGIIIMLTMNMVRIRGQQTKLGVFASLSNEIDDAKKRRENKSETGSTM